MKQTIITQRLEILGRLWGPIGALAAPVKVLDGCDLRNIDNPKDRDDVEHYVALHSGDFSEVVDFRADFDMDGEHIVHDWQRPESECEFSDCMYSSGD